MGGTPKKFIREMVKPAFIMASEGGMTNEQIAKTFGVSLSTFMRWMREHPTLRDAVRKGRDIWDSLTAEECLKKRVTGMEFDEVTYERDTEGNMVETKRVRKTLAPDVAAIKTWLNNRDPERWKDRIEIKETNDDLEERLRSAEKRLNGGEYAKADQS